MSGKVGPLSRIYNGMIGIADKFVPTSMRPLWEHPAGEQKQTRLKQQHAYSVGPLDLGD